MLIVINDNNWQPGPRFQLAARSSILQPRKADYVNQNNNRVSGYSIGNRLAQPTRAFHHRVPPQPAPAFALALALAAAVVNPFAAAGEAPATESAKAEKPPPLPLHQIEGNGGIFATLSAYIVNPPRSGEAIGRPSVGFSYVNLGHGENLEAFTVTESPWKRLELGYGYNNFQLGDLPTQIALSGGPEINESVTLHNFNTRLQLLKEGEFGTKWVPALTLGAHYKNNDGISQINRQLGGTLHTLGLFDRRDGLDFTLYASKLVTGLPRPVLFQAGGRATKGAWNGLAGFTDDYSFLFEGNVVVFLTDRLALAGEYKQLANDYTPVPGLINKAGDWWTVDLAYVVSSHFTVAAGYGHFGGVLNHEANGVWGVTTKFEF
jgi:hypothetical protein